MAHRVFRDERGRVWNVWTAVPSSVERRQGTTESRAVGAERRKRSEYRVKLDERWANGWLVFETTGEKRRLAPIPERWSDGTESDLNELRGRAMPVTPSRRLVE